MEGLCKPQPLTGCTPSLCFHLPSLDSRCAAICFGEVMKGWKQPSLGCGQSQLSDKLCPEQGPDALRASVSTSIQWQVLGAVMG